MHEKLKVNGQMTYQKCAKSRPATVVSITDMIHLLIRIASDPMVKLCNTVFEYLQFGVLCNDMFAVTSGFEDFLRSPRQCK